MSEFDFVEDDVDLDAMDVNVGSLCDDVVVDVDVLLNDVGVGDSPDSFVDDDDADIVVVNLIDIVVDNVVNDRC